MPENLVKRNVEFGIDPGSGKPFPSITANSGLQTFYGTASGTITAATAIATTVVPAGAGVLVLGVRITNEGSSGSAVFRLQSVSGTTPSVINPYYLASPGQIIDQGTPDVPVAVFINTGTSPVTLGVYVISSTASNTYEASISVMPAPVSLGWPSL